MLNNKIRILLAACLIILFASGCANDRAPKLDAWVLNCSQIETLVFRIRNFEENSYFIPENSWVSNIGDTLYIEGIYKRRKDNDPVISYYQFNPPLMQEIKHDSSFIMKIDYKDLQVKISQIVAVRMFKSDIPYDKDKDYQKYHSEKGFLKYENASSFLFFTKVHRLDSIAKW